MNFNNRASYLAWSNAWKASYLEHSRGLRALKVAFKGAQRAQEWSKEASLRSQIRAAKSRANEMLLERLESKAEAQRQYLAARSVESQS